MDKGWIKLHRQLMDKAIWQSSTPQQKVILITLLTMANHKEKEWEWKGKKYVAKPGQFVTSLQSIVDKSGKGITIQNVRTALNKFEKYEFLTSESTKTGRLITIINWDLYQGDNKEINKDDNKELTKDQQSTNKELTPNKNDKNVRMKEYSVCMYDENFKNIIRLLEKNTGVIPPILIDEIYEYSNVFNLDMFSEATKIAANNKKRTVNYILGILRNWKDNNILTIDDLEALRKEKELERQEKEEKQKSQNKVQYPKAKKTRFHNFDQRTESYSNDDLEKIMERKKLEYLERLRNQNAL
ncbi:DnaD domain protein [Anaerosalibacter bizertensis]|uniref:DnaD domain-containing protein n=1 Tax=Anaerosalibacter bizertensis TaxID=932217 RepID=UPI001C0F063C|nr:DnaD domain protein [Anaerosalibacter bizertensis]MBU5292796.1 DnaD domain protein [Anaerosalibacter bizertensis]